jgi:LysM repeat protein
MMKRIIQVALVFMLLAASLASAGEAKASAACPAYYTVQWGDTLGGLALTCGTTVDAIRAANPGLGWYLYAGQTLYIPTGYTTPSQPPAYYPTSTVQSGDTLGKIAKRTGSSVSAILAVNPQISNASLIYAGQVINLPSGVVVQPPSYPPQPPPYYPPPDDGYSTLTIAYRFGMLIRDKPNGKFIVSALNGTTWKYKPGSVYVDSKYRIWVEVKISPSVKGYTSGWLLVTDQFGTFFTEPQITTGW